MKLAEVTKKFIKAHAEKMAPKECCGFIVTDEFGNLKHIQADNISNNNLEFIIDPFYFLTIQSNYNINYIYHSHADPKYINFSETDMICSKNLMKDLILYVVGLNFFKIYNYNTGQITNG